MSAKYDHIGTNYNSTRQADPYLARRIFSLLRPQKGKQYLDIGCGTGNYTIALSGMGARFTGTDPSEKMLGEARSRDHSITWPTGSAEKIPAGDHVWNGSISREQTANTTTEPHSGGGNPILKTQSAVFAHHRRIF